MATGVCDGGANGDLLQATPSTARKNCLVQGGYQCIFVKDPPDHLQTECSVCLCVLREPYLVDCCGYSFCKSCIEPIKANGRPCPLCAVEFTTCIPDKRLQRTLNDLQVYCSHKENGCEWVGQMRDLPQHLNVEPVSEGDRLLGCPLVCIKCTHCDESIQRQYLKEHECDYCAQRPYSCDMCQSYTSTHEDVICNHWPVCPSRPVACPNDCGELPKLEQLDNHLKECPLEVIDCAFSYAGCSERLPRKDMLDHIAENLLSHVLLQATNNEQEIKKRNKQIEELQELYEQSRAEIAGLQEANRLLVKQLEQKYEKAKVEIKREIAVFSMDVRELVPFTFTMPDFEQNKKENTTWYSPSFYTHLYGYKLCLRINANGVCHGENSHVSIFVVMMKGEYDEYLKWPFRGEVTIKLLNQERDDESGAKTKTIHIDDNSANDVAGRVTEGERSRGRGLFQFIRQRDLRPNYLKNDCLRLCVKDVKITST